MAAHRRALSAATVDPLDEPLEPSPRGVERARAHIAETALRPSAGNSVGLELEFHLVDLDRPERRPDWSEVETLVAGLAPLPAGSSVTVEPGGQLELSTPPAADVTAAVTGLRADRRDLARQLGTSGFGTAPLGADPARPVRRINPGSRYVAMERHFAAMGCARPGRTMMSATAALQVNLDAGPPARWASRLRRMRTLAPVLTAMSACSPLLAGQASGWRSMRQQAWLGIDGHRSRPVPGNDPAAAWAAYALHAPVMLGRDLGDGHAEPVTERIPLAAWVAGASTHGLRRRPSLADVDYHLTTLFPPIRPRGYVEIRCLDALPDRWWPALAALTVTLIDDETAGAAADEACGPLRDTWYRAARDGLADPEMHAAARTCMAAAVARCPDGLRADLERYAELVDAARTPGDDVRDRAAAAGPLTVLAEEAQA